MSKKARSTLVAPGFCLPLGLCDEAVAPRPAITGRQRQIYSKGGLRRLLRLSHRVVGKHSPDKMALPDGFYGLRRPRAARIGA
jgi:hypothetical protein